MPTDADPAPSPADEAAKARAASLVGRVISDRYRIVELVAMGGMGAVYRGEHLRMRKRIAIKVLHPDIEGLPDLVARFEREAVAGAHLSDPHAAAAIDFGELDDGSTYLVLEYVAGRTLRALIDEEAPLTPERAARIARQLAAVLGAAHATGIVHRDVKPRNVMILDGDFVKLIDFGLAKVSVDRLSLEAADEQGRRATGPLTGEGVLLGTAAYLAPEAVVGMSAIDESSDLYALGVILYELLAGKHPFEAKTPGRLFKAHRFDLPPPISERVPGVEVPEALEAIAHRLLAKEKSKRFASGEEVVAALDAAIAPAGAAPRIMTSAPPPPESIQEAPQSELPPSATQEAPQSVSTSMDESAPQSASPGSVPEALSASPASVPEPLSASPPPAQVAPIAAPQLPSRSPSWVWYALAIGLLGGAAIGVTSRGSSDPATDAPAEAPGAAHRMPKRSPPPLVAASVVQEAAASASAPAAEPSSATPAESAAQPPVDPRATRATLLLAAEAKDWKQAESALLDLIEAQPAAFRELAVGQATRDVATALEREGHGRGDRVFDALSMRLGETGPDLLYDLVETRGGSVAAKRAALLLTKPEVIGHGTPALRIAFDLRSAPCDAKAAFFNRAVSDGDVRALSVLETIGRACLGKDDKLEAAIQSLKTKVNRRASP